MPRSKPGALPLGDGPTAGTVKSIAVILTEVASLASWQKKTKNSLLGDPSTQIGQFSHGRSGHTQGVKQTASIPFSN